MQPNKPDRQHPQATKSEHPCVDSCGDRSDAKSKGMESVRGRMETSKNMDQAPAKPKEQDVRYAL